MSTIRPAVTKDDGYFKKVIKYIPAEIIAAYTFAVGLITAKDCNGANISIFPWVFLILLLITPIYMYLAVVDNPDIPDPIKKKLAVFHAFISAVALCLWVYALGDTPMICYISPKAYNSVLGSLLLAGFSLITPLLERIIIGKAK